MMKQQGEPQVSGVSAIKWPDTYIGGGCPVVADVQGEQHTASVGCLVGDGHTMYAVTNRHVTGAAGSIVKARVRGNLVEVGKSSVKQLTRREFTEVFPEFPGKRCYLTLDVGLVEVTNAGDWTSRPFGLEGKIGDAADLNELNLGLQLIDQPLTAFGSTSGLLNGKIKALFYRHKTQAGYDYISQFLIAPENGRAQTGPGDSGMVWHLKTIANVNGKDETILRPMAVEWGGQTLVGTDGKSFNFALATGLSTVCRLLDVDLIQEHNVGPTPYWGQTGHYSIATSAIAAVQDKGLRDFLQANVERISFRPDHLTPEAIRAKLANGDFVELADVPDLVWKKTADKVLGGRDYAQNAGPEHPNHYADIDGTDANGLTLRDQTLADNKNMSVAVWLKWYEDVGQTDSRHQGLLPFRVWQFFDEMVGALSAGDQPRFLCAAGIVSHYIGDACQPLHGSVLSDGLKSADEPNAKQWPGKGVHSAYEDKMVDRHSADLLPKIEQQAKSFTGRISAITDGRDAATATVQLMADVAGVLSPKSLCDEYIRLGGGASAHVVDGLWEAFGEQTAEVMGIGARYLAAVWDAAYVAAGQPAWDDTGPIAEKVLAVIYQDKTFVPSLTLNKIASVLKVGA